jgi:hypothetical protein
MHARRMLSSDCRDVKLYLHELTTTASVKYHRVVSRFLALVSRRTLSAQVTCTFNAERRSILVEQPIDRQL